MANHSLTTLSNTVATRLTPLGIHSGMDITLQNVNSSGYIYIGGTSNIDGNNYGFRLLPNQALSVELNGKDALFALASTTNMKIAVLKTGLESGS